MSSDIIESGGTGAKAKAQVEKLFRESYLLDYFSVHGLVGTDSDSVIQQYNEFEKTKGETVEYTLEGKLTGEGVEGDTTLKGKEERPEYQDFDLTLRLMRHAVLLKDIMSDQRSFVPLKPNQEMNIKRWLSQKREIERFKALQDSPTTVDYGGDATSWAGIDAADVVTSEQLRKLRINAETGFNGAQEPIRGVMVEGEEMFIYLTNPMELNVLYKDSVFRESLKYGAKRGSDNPLFKTAAGVTAEGVIIHTSRHIPVATNGTVPVTKSLFLGAQSLIEANGMRKPLIVESEDYEAYWAGAVSLIAEWKKPKFNNPAGTPTDWAVVSVQNSCPDFSS